MIARTTLSPNQAKDYGLVHEIESVLFPADAELAVIGEPAQKAQLKVVHATAPMVQAYTRLRDHGVLAQGEGLTEGLA
jgi:hypothetical protein